MITMTRAATQSPTSPVVVVVYQRATSWLVASLAGDLEPRRVAVEGDDELDDAVQQAFPAAEIRRGPVDGWADLVVRQGVRPARSRWERLILGR